MPITDTRAEGTALHQVHGYIILNNAKILCCWVNSNFIFHGSTCVLCTKKAGRNSGNSLQRAEVAHRGWALNSALMPPVTFSCRFQKGLQRQHTQLMNLQFNSITLTLHSRFSNIWGPIVQGSEQSWNRPFLQQPCNMKDKIKWLKRENRWAVYQHVECRFLPKAHSSHHQSSSFTSTHPPEGVCTFAFISSRLTPVNQLTSFYSCLAIKLLQVTAALLTLIYSTAG